MKGSIQSSREAGFSMIEVLVTIIIVAIGLLGYAGLQVYGLKSNLVAMQHSLATIYANGIIDCMRSNRAGVSGYRIASYINTRATDGSVAGDDTQAWLDAIRNNLPAGKARLTDVAGVYTIEIQWKESISAGDGGTHTFKTETSL